MKIIFLLISLCLAPLVQSQYQRPMNGRAPRPRRPLQNNLNHVHSKRQYGYQPGSSVQARAPPIPQSYQRQFIPPAPAPQSQQAQYGPAAPQPGYNRVAQHPNGKRQFGAVQQMAYPQQKVMNGVDRIAAEIVDAVVNRLEAAEAMALEMEKQGVDPDAPPA